MPLVKVEHSSTMTIRLYTEGSELSGYLRYINASSERHAAIAFLLKMNVVTWFVYTQAAMGKFGALFKTLLKTSKKFVVIIL